MDDFPGLLTRDFGFRPQGKNAPMSATKSASAAAPAGGGVGLGSGSGRSSSAAWSRSSDSVLGVGVFDDRSPPGYDDVFGAPPKYSNSSSHGRSGPAPSSSSPTSLDSIFDGFKDPPPKSSSLPVYDKPVYDDDIFDGVPGVKNTSSSILDDVFSTILSPPNRASSPPFDDLLGKLGKTMPEAKGSDRRSREQNEQDLSAFDELIPGFGGSSAPRRREPQEAKQQSAASSAKATSEDPFVVLESTSTSTYQSTGMFTDPLEHISRSVNSGSAKVDAASLSGGVLDDLNAYDELTSSAPFFTSEVNSKSKDRSPPKADEEPPQRSSIDYSENPLPEMHPTKSSNSSKSVNRRGGQNSDRSFNTHERSTMEDQMPKSYEHLETADDAWLTVAEIPLFTQPTTAPPPSRPPPPVAIKQTPFEKRDQFSPVGLNARRKDNNPFLQTSQNEWKNSVKRPTSSPADEFDGFDIGRPQRYANDHAEVLTGEEDIETNLAAAAMKEAMDRAELKFKQAREVRGREHDARSAKSREFQQERDEKLIPNAQDFEEKEKQDKLEREREQREREERRRREREREQELERERERERARQAVERATREARERAADEARLKAERAAVGKANAEARQRAAERAVFQKAANEARERAAIEAREKAAQEARASEEAREKDAAAEVQRKAAAEAQEKAAAEMREKAALERAAVDAQRRAERIAVERATKEARERAAAEAQRRAAAVATAAREKQQKTENDLESFFNMGARPNSAPKQRTPNMENVVHPQSRGNSDGVRRTSPSSSSSIRKAQSTTNLVDDLASVFGAPSSHEVFQDIEGESEERRRARLERNQRTLERTKKALAEKNERDIQAQREQAERHRFAETLDIEIKRWAAGKEGNLRALLSTLHYVLWPESGWQPVSLTDLITGASVKKVYRKATLCIHPDKVQQKGATLQQKYIAEKVFDLLKEAWNKLNSEELF